MCFYFHFILKFYRFIICFLILTLIVIFTLIFLKNIFQIYNLRIFKNNNKIISELNLQSNNF